MLKSKLYPDCRILGPYFAKDKGRWYVMIMRGAMHVQNMHYARFLMQEHLERFLSLDEEVDHIDEDKTNDVITNLQLLTKPENIDKSQRKWPKAEDGWECIWCDATFIMTDKKRREWENKCRAGKAGPFCSASCAAKYSAQQRKA